MEDRQQYTCPQCGAVGAGAKGASYSCHRCKEGTTLLPSQNGKIIKEDKIMEKTTEYSYVNRRVNK